MTVSYTPGPWTVSRAGTGELMIYGGVGVDPITEARPVIVAHVPSTRSPNPMWRQVEECEANARLIAAAPEMFDALERIASDVACPSEPGLLSDTEALNEARSLLADCREIANAALARLETFAQEKS